MEVFVALIVNGYYCFREGKLKDYDKLYINIKEFVVIINEEEHLLPRKQIFENSEDCCEYIARANSGMFA